MTSFGVKLKKYNEKYLKTGKEETILGCICIIRDHILGYWIVIDKEVDE